MLGRSFQVVSMVPSGLMVQVPSVVDGRDSASSAKAWPLSSMFCSLLAGRFWAWMAPPEVEALAERLMTKPLGSRERAMVKTLGPLGAAGAAACWLAPPVE